MNKNDVEELGAELVPTTTSNQNLQNIEHISATRTGSVTDVLHTMRSCEALELTPDQTAMMYDILYSINEHPTKNAVAGYYLVRYGMLLERERRHE